MFLYIFASGLITLVYIHICSWVQRYKKKKKIQNIIMNLLVMIRNQLKQKENSDTLILDSGLEARLLASQLVSEVYRSAGHVSFTFTDSGVLAFAQAMQLAGMEERSSMQATSQSLFPESDNSLISKKEVMNGLGVSHTTLWKWEQKGYLVPIRVGKKVYYRRSDIEKLTK